MKLTPGKLSGMKRVSNERGVIAAAAMDQRGSLSKALAAEKGGGVPDTTLEEFKNWSPRCSPPCERPFCWTRNLACPLRRRRAKG